MKMKPLAIAVGAAMPLAALAADLTGTTATVSSEYLATVKRITPAAGAEVALGAQYNDGDVIKFTFSAPPRGPLTSSPASTATYAFPGSVAIVVDGATDGAATLFDQTDTTVSYRVSTAPAAGGNDRGVIAIPDDIGFLASEIGSGVTVTTSSQAGTIAFDAAKKPLTLVKPTGSQFAYTISGLSQTIDVESARKAFAVSGGTSSSHSIAITVDDAVKSPIFAETGGNISITLTGDFSWIDASTATNATGIQTTGTITGDFTPVGVSATAITLSGPATGTRITLSNANKLTIPVQTTGLQLKQALSQSTTVTTSASAAGAYKLNGSSITVYAVPTSSAVSNFIWLSNTGKTTGDVSITVYDNGKTIDLGVVGTSKGGTEFDVTAAMNAALEAKGVTLSGGRVHMDVVTNVPNADAAISAAYRVGDDRVNLLTSAETN